MQIAMSLSTAFIYPATGKIECRDWNWNSNWNKAIKLLYNNAQLNYSIEVGRLENKVEDW